LLELVADEDDRLPLLLELLERGEALLLEPLVADGEHLVEEKDVERDLDRNGVRQPDEHSRRVVLELLIDESLELRKGEDLVEPVRDLPLREAGQRRVDADVVACIELEVEADA